MIIFGQEGTFFVYLEGCKRIGIEMEQGGPSKDTHYAIYADGEFLGAVHTIKEAKDVLNKIAFAFKTAQCECDPW